MADPVDVLITVHYEIWDDEAVDIGQSDDRGTEKEDEPYTWKEAIQAIRNGGPWEPSSIPLCNGRDWIHTCDSDFDFRTGERKERSMHFRKPSGALLSLHQLRRLLRAAKVIR